MKKKQVRFSEDFIDLYCSLGYAIERLNISRSPDDISRFNRALVLFVDFVAHSVIYKDFESICLYKYSINICRYDK